MLCVTFLVEHLRLSKQVRDSAVAPASPLCSETGGLRLAWTHTVIHNIQIKLTQK